MSQQHCLLILILSLCASIFSEQIYPGTINRPILSDEEAEILTPGNYLAPWVPGIIKIPNVFDYVVTKTVGFRSVQDAVNAAVLQSIDATERKFIFVDEGVYEETVYFPAGSPPLTLVGHNSRIVLNLSANLPVEDWVNKVNPDGQRFKEGDPSYSIFQTCAKSDGSVGTRCSCIAWAKTDKLHLIDITIENTAYDAQAVALKIDADEVQLENVTLISHQDTVYIGSGSMFVNNSYIVGNTDYICGAGKAVFNNCTFNTISIHKDSNGVIFAPKTDPNSSYGFLVINSILSADEGFLNTSNVRLARSWETTEYLPDVAPNGQLLIRNTRIDNMINVTLPWDKGIGSNREYQGNIDLNRDLNDNHYNRFWEYQNFGAGT